MPDTGVSARTSLSANRRPDLAGPLAPRLLVVDDDPSIRGFLADYGYFSGFVVVACADGQEALRRLEGGHVDLALVDLRMPGIDGLEVIRAIRERDPVCEVVLMSGAGTIGTAVQALKLGARDYLEKPFDLTVLEHLLNDVRRDTFPGRKAAAVADVSSPGLSDGAFCGMVGHTPVMHQLWDTIRRLAPQARTALVTGEIGAGKELAARALHAMGPRAAKSFVTVDCSGLAEPSGESDLFGHVHGAFAGATEDRAGAFEVADGAVLFLDEIGELPLALQGRLLRVLEHGEVHRSGSLVARKVDVVVLAATRRDLRTEMMAGRFRPELFYRLGSATVHVPPLRERKEDIPDLTATFLKEFAGRVGRPVIGLTAAAEALVHRHEWKGNVRELRNAIERAAMMSDGGAITDTHLLHALE